jgi:hypothetical protein
MPGLNIEMLQSVAKGLGELKADMVQNPTVQK